MRPTLRRTPTALQGYIQSRRLSDDVRTMERLFGSTQGRPGAPVDPTVRTLCKSIREQNNHFPAYFAVLCDALGPRVVRKLVEYLDGRYPTAHPVRSLHQLDCEETALEGRLNNLQMQYESGDHSPAVLAELIAAADAYLPVCKSMREAACIELHGTAGSPARSV